MTPDEWREFVREQEEASDTQRREGGGTGLWGCLIMLVQLGVSFAFFTACVWLALYLLGR